MKLPDHEIKKRLVRLANLENLHTAQLKRNEKLVTQVKVLKKENQTLKDTVIELTRTVETLMLRIEELEKMIFKSKKKDDVDDDFTSEVKEVKKGKAQRTKDSYKRAIPTDITRAEHHTVDKCLDCNTKLTNKTKSVWYVEDIILPDDTHTLKETIKHVNEKGWCTHCKKWRWAHPPPYTDVVIGENVRMLTTHLSVIGRLSYTQIRYLLRDIYNFTLSDGEIANILTTEAKKLRPEYESLKNKVRNQKGIHCDETTYRVQKESTGNYAWVMTGTETDDAVFVIGASRGKGNAEELVEESNAVGITDNYGAYKHLFTEHQLCLAHPHRKFRDLSQSEKLDEEKRKHCLSVFNEFRTLYHKTQEVLQQSFDITKRKRQRTELLKQLDAITVLNANDPEKLTKLGNANTFV